MSAASLSEVSFLHSFAPFSAVSKMAETSHREASKFVSASCCRFLNRAFAVRLSVSASALREADSASKSRVAAWRSEATRASASAVSVARLRSAAARDDASSSSAFLVREANEERDAASAPAPLLDQSRDPARQSRPEREQAGGGRGRVGVSGKVRAARGGRGGRGGEGGHGL